MCLVLSFYYVTSNMSILTKLKTNDILYDNL